MGLDSSQTSLTSAGRDAATAPNDLMSFARLSSQGLSIETAATPHQRVDPLISGNPALWAEVAARSYREGILPSDFSNTSVVLLGDSNHSNIAVQKGFLDLLPTLKLAGITHLAIEIPSDIARQDLHQYADRIHAPHLTERLIAAADRLGLKIEFIDMPFSERDGSPGESARRGVFMGERVSDILRGDSDARVAVVSGYGHVRDAEQIIGVLETRGVSCKSFLCVGVSQGETLPTGMGISPVELDVLQGIRAGAGAQISHGVLNLEGLPTTVDAVLVFPRPVLMSIESRVLNALPAPETVAEVALLPSHGRLNVSAFSSFANPDLVEGESRNWERSNQLKIIDFTAELARLNELRPGEAVHIASLLSAHQNCGAARAFGGSIVGLGFVADGQFFEIVTVNTLGHRFVPDADYGSLMQHNHITLERLRSRYDYSALSGIDAPPIPKEVAPSQDSTALLRFVPYAVYGPSHPRQVYLFEPIGGPPELRVAFEPVPGPHTPFVTALHVEDFSLTAPERRLLDQREGLREFVNAVENFRSHPAIKEIRSDEGGRVTLRQGISDLWNRVERLELPSDIRADVRSLNPSRDILLARTEFRTLEANEAAVIGERGDRFTESFEALTERIGQYLKRHPDIAQAADERRSMQRGVTPLMQHEQMVAAIEKLKLFALK